MYGGRVEEIVRNAEAEPSVSYPAYKVLFSRYTYDVPNNLDEFARAELPLLELPTLLRNLIDMESITNKSILFPESQVPAILLDNNKFARNVLREKLDQLLHVCKDAELTQEALQGFMISNHEWIKWSLNTWFLVNSGTMAELVVIDENIEGVTLDWMRQEFGVEIGQPITHPHLISENGKRRLHEAGYPRINKHLTAQDYTEMLVACYRLSISSEGSKGFFGRSWIYNPAIHHPLSDGKPFAAFDFLQYDHMAGVRKHLATASPTGMFPEQHLFATRNQRRKQIVESGEFDLKVYAIFHTNEFLRQNIESGLLN